MGLGDYIAKAALMRKLILAAAMLGLAAPLGFGQGYVVFSITTTTSNVKTNGLTVVGNAAAYNGAPLSTTPGVSWYYMLLVAPTTQTTIDASLTGWTGVFEGTNTTTAGRMFGWNSPDGGAVLVPGYSSTDTVNFAVVGWSANLGSDWIAVFSGKPSVLVSGVGNYGQAFWLNTSAPPPTGWSQANLDTLGVGPGGWYGISPIAFNVPLGPPGGPYCNAFRSSCITAITSTFLNYYATTNCGAPPVIAFQPKDVVAATGQNVTLKVSANPLCVGYQWQLAGTNLPGATSNPYVLTNVQLANAGRYSVIVSNAWGSITSAAAVVRIGLPVMGVYSTGIGSGGTSLPGGSTDPHWTLVGTVTGAATVLSAGSTYSQWSPDTTNSSWVGVGDSANQPTNLPYSFNQTFNISGFDPATLVLWGTWWGDDSTSLLLNGHVITNSPFNATGIPWYVDGLSGWFFSGTNTLSIAMNSADGVYDGVRIEVLGFIGQLLPCTNPPSITAQPQDQVAFVGENAVFSVAASGATYPCAESYQWLLDGKNLAGATDSGFKISGAQSTDAGTYSVIVTNASGSMTSTPAILQVLPPNAPSTSINGRIAVGTVFAIGSAQLSFSGGFTNGFTFYTLDGTTPTTSSAFYNGPVTLTNSAIVQAMSLSSDFSQSAFSPAVTVQITPGWNLQTSVVGSGTVMLNPSSGTYPSNSVVVLTATAAANWAFDHWTGDLSGSQNPASLIMNGPRSVQAVFVQTAYPLTVSTPGGGTVTVNGQIIPPQTFYRIGSTQALFATASNGWSFIQWQGDVTSTNNPLNLTITQTNNVQGIFGTVVGTNVAGSGSVVLSPPNPVPYGTNLTATAIPAPGYYFRLWSGALSGTNNPANFIVTSATPTVGALFSPVPGGSCTLNVTVNGKGTVSVSPQQIYYTQGQTVMLTASQTDPAYSFNSWSGDASGTSNPLTLVLNTNKVVVANFGSVPSVTITPQSQIVLGGSNALLHANVIGLGPLGYQWYHGVGLIGGATNVDYAILNAQLSDSGSYSVIVSNYYGMATSAVATITVVLPPAITTEPTNALVIAGTSYSLSVAATGTSPLSYQWFDSLGSIPGATNATLAFNPIQTNNADSYFAIVTNLYGFATSQVATVTVYIPVNILSEPVSQIAPARSTVSFHVAASGYPSPTYQWTFNTTNLPGATSSALTIANVQLSNLGSYAVLVSNPYSSLLSDTVTLSMSPSITVPYNGGTAVWGRSAFLSVGAIGSGSLSYQWYFNGSPILSATNPIYGLPTAQLTNSGFYAVIISSAYGSVTNGAQFIVNPADTEMEMFAGMRIGGVAGYSYVIQGSMNLQDTNAWVTLTNLVLQQDTEIWVDTSTNALTAGRRYYRILPGQ
ncbi:MAG: hypothetical protein C5B50_13910 [Verrucomicrobia bacterium]|nr:MAG: hypothetical protein C5B50_13910 [Verrucomicrobiota bacterium]